MQRWWQVCVRALRGEEHDYTQGDLREAVILLAVPMILELGLESVFAIVDMFFVSKLGANAIATVGLTESVVTLIYSVAIGIGTGATAIVARRVGEKNPAAASHAAAQAMSLAAGIALFLSLFGSIFAAEILRLMGASPQVVEEGSGFARLMLGGSLPILLLFLLNGIFRGAGDAAMAMRSLWLASGMNIILCPIFIYAFGLKGAALATVIGRSTGVVYQLYQLQKGRSLIHLHLAHFLPDPIVLRSLLAIAWPATLQFLIGSGSWIILTRLVAETGGTAASAGYQVAFRNFVFFILPAWGLSNAAATLVGQNLGAKLVARAEAAVITTARFSVALMAAVSLLLLLLADDIVQIYTQDPEVLRYGSEALRIIAVGYVFYGFGMVMTQALNGAGDTKAPTWINVICFWLFQTPCAYLLVHYLGARGAIIAIPLAHGLLAMLAFIYFKRGHWKQVQV